MFPPLFDRRPNYGGSNEDNGDLLQRVPSMHCYTQCPEACSRPPQPTPLLETPGHSWASLDQSLVGHCSFLLGPGAQGSVVPSKSLFPRLYKFWQLYGGVNSDFLQEYLCHTQVYCTQRPYPCSSPLLTLISSVDTQHSSVSVSLGSLGPNFTPPSVLLGLSALGHGVSPHSRGLCYQIAFSLQPTIVI